MANKTYQGRIVQKHDSSANWAKATNFIPLKGEIIIYDDLNKIKIGDGTTKVNDLDFSSSNGLPEGGTAGDTLVKDTDGGSWETPVEATLISLPIGILKSDGTTISKAVAGTDYAAAPNKYTFTVTNATQSTFTIPFDFEDSGALTVFYNGIMMKETENYTISGKTITLVGFNAEKDDYITVMGIEGVASINVDEKVAIIQEAVSNAETSIDNKVKAAGTTINTKVNDALTTIDNKLATIPDDVTQAVYKNKSNIMTKNGKITMDSSYTPSADGDIATKKYVDSATPATFTSSKAGTVPASGGGTAKYLRADGTWTTIDKTPVIGTNTNYAIYIGTTAPASGTTPLLWIDTTSSTGFLKYRSSNTSAWTAVPVAWT